MVNRWLAFPSFFSAVKLKTKKIPPPRKTKEDANATNKPLHKPGIFLPCVLVSNLITNRSLIIFSVFYERLIVMRLTTAFLVPFGSLKRQRASGLSCSRPIVAKERPTDKPFLDARSLQRLCLWWLSVGPSICYFLRLRRPDQTTDTGNQRKKFKLADLLSVSFTGQLSLTLDFFMTKLFLFLSLGRQGKEITAEKNKIIVMKG